jgi:hypothetical protein
MRALMHRDGHRLQASAEHGVANAATSALILGQEEKRPAPRPRALGSYAAERPQEWFAQAMGGLPWKGQSRVTLQGSLFRGSS